MKRSSVHRLFRVDRAGPGGGGSRLHFEALEDRRLLAASPELLKEIGAGSDGSAPDFVVEASGINFFTADDGVNGHELWRTDGTPAGTTLVKDINPGSAGSMLPDTTRLTAVGSAVFFWADDGTHGLELWTSDGTEAGTVLVKDINPGSADAASRTSSYVTKMVNVGGTLFFGADSATYGEELWKSDGTEAGTMLVKDISAGSSDGVNIARTPLTNVNGVLYFRGDDDTLALWKSDGTEAGTVKVLDGGGIEHVNFNGTLFFSGSQGIWKTDGTEAGTVQVKKVALSNHKAHVKHLTVVGNTLFFSAERQPYGQELWASDGTEAGTVMVKDIQPASHADSQPTLLTNVGGTLFFMATDDSHGKELWKSDGTEVGTVMVKDINPGTSGSYHYWRPDSAVNVGGTLFFAARDDALGIELWKSDGTEAGTVLVRDIRTGSIGSYAKYLSSAGGTAFFNATTATEGAELWTSDGTEAGTTLVKDLNTQSEATRSDPRSFTKVGPVTFFVATDPAHGEELWKTDGTEAGTVMVKDVNPGDVSSSISSLVNVDGVLLFSADDGVNGEELWKSDGTEAGTVQVKDIYAGTADSGIFGINFNGALVFSARDSGNNRTDNNLWISDGTTAGTVLLKDNSGSSLDLDPQGFTIVGNTLFFSADSPGNGRELWKTDGTTAGTVMVKNIVDPGDSYPKYLQNSDGTLFFTAGGAVWKSDGTTAGTVLASSSVTPKDLVDVNGTFFFHTVFGSPKLWKSDGTPGGTAQVTDLPGIADDLININGTLFFNVDDPSTGEELWTSDGTPSGTVLVKDINPAGDSRPRALINVNGALFFRADDGSGGEFWTSDGTAAGTTEVADLDFGFWLSIADIDGTAYFGAAEPYVLRSPSVAIDLNGGGHGTDSAVVWAGAPLALVDPTATLDAAGVDVVWLTAQLTNPQTGDVLAADTSGTSIAASFDGTTLSLSGTDTAAHYQQVLRTITYNNPSTSAVVTQAVEFLALNVNGYTPLAVDATIFEAGSPQIDLNGLDPGPGIEAAWDGVPIVLPSSAATISDPDSTQLSSLEVVLLTGEAGDVLAADTTGTGIAASFDGTTLTLSGNHSLADYQQVLRTVTYDYTGPSPLFAPKLVTFTARDELLLAGNDALALINFDVRVDLNGPATGTSYDATWSGIPATVADSSATLSVPGGLNVTSLSVELLNPELGDLLTADTTGANIGATFDGTTLDLFGSDTRANYEAVLRTITYTGGAPQANLKTLQTVVVDALSNVSNTAISTIEISPKPFQYLLKDIRAGVADSSPTGFADLNGLGYFVANDGTSGPELWKTDGTLAGTVRVKDLNPGPSGASIDELTGVGGTLFFTGTDGTYSGLWKSDGTESGTVLVKDVTASSLINVGGTLLFVGNDGVNGNELWKSDGTVAGTVMVKEISSAVDSDPRYFTEVNGTLFFVADDVAHGGELWKSDGTQAGTVLVKDVRPGPESSIVFNAFSNAEFENVNGVLYFRADDGVDGEAIWKSDGTQAGTVLVADNPNPPGAFTSFSAHNFTNVNGTLFFAAQFHLFGVELWRLNGDSAVLAADIFPGEGPTSSFPDNLTPLGDKLFFTASDGQGIGLWTINSSGTGETELQDGTASQLLAVRDQLFFRLQQTQTGRELWQSDGTAGGTKIVLDLASGPAHSDPVTLGNLNGALLFGARDGAEANPRVGSEPRIVRVPGADTAITARRLFYDNSTFDQNLAGAGSTDDDAIATDKLAYLPGTGIVQPVHMTSYSRGINGIMIDIADAAGTITAADFTFRVSGTGLGANNAPSSWIAAPPPAQVAVRVGAGLGSADRIEFIWNDGDIANRYLEITVQGNDAAGGFNTNTGLAASDVFYFGNIIGDTFNDASPTTFLTTAADEIEIQPHVVSTASVTSPYDMDRNGVHLASDRIVTRGNTIFALNRISISNPPAAPVPLAGSSASSAVASALTIPDAPPGEQRTTPEFAGPTGTVLAAHLDSPAAPIHEATDPRARAILTLGDQGYDDSWLDDELLGPLFARN